MAINAWKTNLIGLGIPPKVISGAATTIVNKELWPHSYDANDPYYSAGSQPKPYRFQITFSIPDNSHGSHLSRIPFIYNAQDVEVGDFVSGADDGKTLQVMSIITKTNDTLVAICEDRLRYNTYRSAGSPAFNTGNVIFFQLNEQGLPMFDPLPGTASVTFYANVMSRFQYLNPLSNYILEKSSHGFERGDAISIDGGTFVKTSTSTVNKFIGTVTQAGPGPDLFLLKPSNGIIDFVPGLPGSVGDFIYPAADGSGDMTTTDTTGRKLFIKIADAIESSTVGTGIDPTGSAGDVVEINKVQISLGASGSYTLSDAVTAINAATSSHKVTASAVGAATTATSNTSNLAYGVIAGYTPFSASINGTSVSFTTVASGSVAYGDPLVADVNDMAADINSVGIANIVASVDSSGNLVLTNSIGGAITIVNGTNDTNGTPFAGAASLTGLALNTPANTTTFALKLARADGGPLTLYDNQGSFFNTAGVKSGQNGRFALGLQIENGIAATGGGGSSTISVVADIAARDALTPTLGSQAYVINDGNSEWALYLWDGTQWRNLSSERSAATDAQTLVGDFNVSSLPTGLSTDSLGTIKTGSTINSVRVLVTSACPSGSTIEIKSGTNVIFSSSDARLSEVGYYQVDTNYLLTANETAQAELTLGSTGSGNVTVLLSYA